MRLVPSMLIARLEDQILILYEYDNNWCVVDKVEDVDVPNSIQSIKDGYISLYVNSLKYFKDFCVEVKNNLKKSSSMKVITNSKKNKTHLRPKSSSCGIH